LKEKKRKKKVLVLHLGQEWVSRRIRIWKRGETKKRKKA